MVNVRHIHAVRPNQSPDETSTEEASKRARDRCAQSAALGVRAQTHAPNRFARAADPATRKDPVREELDHDAHRSRGAKCLRKRLGEYADTVVRSTVPSGDEEYRRRVRPWRGLSARSVGCRGARILSA